MATDYFARDFSDSVQDDNANSAPKIDYFARDFSGNNTTEEASSSEAPRQYSPEEIKSIMKSPKGLKINPAKNREAFGAGVGQSARDVVSSFDKPAEWLDEQLGNPTLGGIFPSAKEAATANLSARKKYEEAYGNNSDANAGRIIGQIGLTLPAMGALGEGAAAIKNTLTEAAPIMRFLGGNVESNALRDASGALVKKATIGNELMQIASKGASGAGQGATAAALTSGASDIPVGEQIETGALLGGGIGVGGKALLSGAKAGTNYLRELVKPFTEKGRSNIANRIVNEFAGEPLQVQANQLVPGSTPTLAEASAHPGIASLQDTLRDINSRPFVERQAANAEARKNLLMESAGTPQDIEAAEEARTEYTQKLLGDPNNDIKGTLFENANPVNPSPVVATIDKILAGPSGNREAVSTSLQKIRSKIVTNEKGAGADLVSFGLTDPRKQLETDPERLYHSVRKQIGDLLDKKDLTNPAGRQAARELMHVQDSLDDVIEKGAPGFKDYLNGYTEASKPIEAMKWMQELNLTDASGNITLPKINNALNNVNKLQSSSGVNAAKSLSKDQVTTLQSIRDDLLRQQNLTLGKSFGSPTVQKGGAKSKLQSGLPGQEGLFSNKLNPEIVGAVLGNTAGATLGLPGAGTFLGGLAGKAIKSSYALKNQLIRNRLEEIMLHPELYSSVINDADAAGGILQNPITQRRSILGGLLRNNLIMQNERTPQNTQ